MATAMNVKQTMVVVGKMEKRAAEMRKLFWPNIEDAALWDRKKAAGFTTMPRTMPHVMNIIDSLSKGQPAGVTYLSIWCRLFYPGIVELGSEAQMAREAGFTGERAVDTWRKRMRKLKELGFIEYHGGGSHDFQWVLVLNPHHAIQRLGDKVQLRLRGVWQERAIEVGARDISGVPAEQIVSAKPLTKKIETKKLKKQA